MSAVGAVANARVAEPSGPTVTADDVTTVIKPQIGKSAMNRTRRALRRLRILTEPCDVEEDVRSSRAPNRPPWLTRLKLNTCAYSSRKHFDDIRPPRSG